MNRYVLRRLALIPLVLIAVNFFGFAYAHLVQPAQLARNPFLAVTTGSTPVLPALALASPPGAGEPFWQVTLSRNGKPNGGALVPGRLYVTTGDGALYAIGDP